MMGFIAFILWTIIVFFTGAVIGSMANDKRILQRVEKFGSFRIDGKAYYAIEKTTKDVPDQMVCPPSDTLPDFTNLPWTK